MRPRSLVFLLVPVLALAAPGCRRKSGGAATSSDDATESGEGIPKSVFGGGQPVTVVVDASNRVKLHFAFESDVPIDDPTHRFIERWQVFPAGHTELTVAIPPEFSGGLDAGLVEPKVGDTVKLVVRAGGKELADDPGPLERPLEPGTAFFAQVNVDDWVTLEPASD